MRTAKQIFDDELSGEPLTEESVIEAIKITLMELRKDFVRELREIRLRNTFSDDNT